MEMVLFHTHNKATGGHFGLEKTLDKVKSIGWWSSREEDVQNWIQYCEECQRYKVRNDNTRPPMRPINPRYVEEIWASDIAIFPPSRQNNRFVLVIMEYLSK